MARWGNLNLLVETFVLARFGFIGIFSTLAHLTTIWFVLENTAVPILIANLIAFAVAFSVSFLGHYFYTFKMSARFYRSLCRFLLISTIALFSSTLLLEFLMLSSMFSRSASVLISASIIPMVSFAASRIWGFRP